MITHPVLVDASAILALVLVTFARLRIGTPVGGGVLVGPIDTVGIAVADPFLRNALSPAPLLVLGAGKLLLLVAHPVVCKEGKELSERHPSG